ncbi:MAG: hypothetical protein JXB49_37065 [Bacteroidales bacterium]|nr:hypothetical protein [Bacteroidales bacterium]
MKIVLYFESFRCEAEVYETITGKAILDVLPLECSINTWGDEIYFSIAPALKLEADAREITTIGELGYWPSGKAFCIFFGPTPASINDEPHAVSPVNIFGKLSDTDIVSSLRTVKHGEKIRVEIAKK